MKDTGIVRRIDELGRIVIPKEIRRKLGIKEGDPLEIGHNDYDEVVLRRYSPLGVMKEARNYVEALSGATGIPCCLCDRDAIIASWGLPELREKDISSEIQTLLDTKQTWYSDGYPPCKNVVFSDSNTYLEQVIMPIISDGEVLGGIILLKKDNNGTKIKDALFAVETLASLIGKQILL